MPVKPEHIKAIQSGLVAVINEAGGTARRVRLPGITVAGKTGTAQVVGLKFEKSFGKETDVPWKYRSHGLFVAYAPADDPQIAVGVVVEHGMHGGSAAGPVAREVMKQFFGIREEGDPPAAAPPEPAEGAATPAAQAGGGL